ncbi:MAG TPA: hypothetical protein VKP30_03620, partial [Polyangiaceae bacterium]|nr:hypothetical protein [Polyangiaceae bacterium]
DLVRPTESALPVHVDAPTPAARTGSEKPATGVPTNATHERAYPHAFGTEPGWPWHSISKPAALGKPREPSVTSGAPFGSTTSCRN